MPFGVGPAGSSRKSRGRAVQADPKRISHEAAEERADNLTYCERIHVLRATEVTIYRPSRNQKNATVAWERRRNHRFVKFREESTLRDASGTSSV
jgi:hypothetical protein